MIFHLVAETGFGTTFAGSCREKPEDAGHKAYETTQVTGYTKRSVNKKARRRPTLKAQHDCVAAAMQ
jgi:hypothetical protein